MRLPSILALAKDCVKRSNRANAVAGLLCYPCFVAISEGVHDPELEKSLQTDEERSYEWQDWSYICEKDLDCRWNYVEDCERVHAYEIFLRGIG